MGLNVPVEMYLGFLANTLFIKDVFWIAPNKDKASVKLLA